jgi:hypothetical protein
VLFCLFCYRFGSDSLFSKTYEQNKQQQDGIITPLDYNQPSLMTKCKIKPPHANQYSSVASKITAEDYERDGMSFLKNQPAPNGLLFPTLYRE